MGGGGEWDKGEGGRGKGGEWGLGSKDWGLGVSGVLGDEMVGRDCVRG